MYTSLTAALFGDAGADGAWERAGRGTLLLVLGGSTSGTTLVEAQLTQPATLRPRLFMVATDNTVLPQTFAQQFVARLHIPPLRAHPDDILPLALSFAGGQALGPDISALLEHYHWPGNSAELRGVITRARHLAGDEAMTPTHLPRHIAIAESLETPLVHLPPEGVNLEDVEQSLIRQALGRARGNKSRAAELLGLTRHTLLYRLEKYGIGTDG